MTPALEILPRRDAPAVYAAPPPYLDPPPPPAQVAPPPPPAPDPGPSLASRAWQAVQSVIDLAYGP